MTYPNLNTLNATSDLSNILIYVNTLTDGAAVPAMLFAFFVIVMVGGYFINERFGRQRNFPANFTVAGFTTFGFAVIMSLKNGLLNPVYLVTFLGLSILGVVWMYLSSE